MPSKSGKSDSLMVAVSNSMLIVMFFCSAVENDWMVLASRTCAVKALLLLMVLPNYFFYSLRMQQ
jgi:hypothetical protein